MAWWNKNLYYDLKSDYNFYINISDDKIWKQKCLRFVDDAFTVHIKDILKGIKENENKMIEKLQNRLKSNCAYSEMVKQNAIWNTDYKKQKYKFMSSDKIYEKVSNII